MDQHIHGAITRGLRARGIDVITAEEDHNKALADPDLLTRAGELGRVLFSYDEDLPIEAARRQRAGDRFSGLFFARPWEITIGQAIDGLELACRVYEPKDIADRVEYLPL